MTRFLLRRIGEGLVLIFIVTAITFFLTAAANIPIARNLLGPSASEAQVAAMNAKLGLDQPVVQRYFEWLVGVAHGDLGTSYFTSQPVGDAIMARLPVTLSVLLVASILTILISGVLGIVGASKGGVTDGVIQGVSIVTYVFPGIILGIVMVYVFAIQLKWVPAIGYVPFADSPIGWIQSIILPAILLSIGGIATVASQLRGSMVDELGREYVRTLRSRGAGTRSILYKHTLRNAAGPALTTFSLQFIVMFGGSLFIEKIFALPGFGTYAYTTTIQGDLPAMLGVTLVSVGLVVVVNTIVDLANGWLNPKVRTE